MDPDQVVAFNSGKQSRRLLEEVVARTATRLRGRLANALAWSRKTSEFPASDKNQRFGFWPSEEKNQSKPESVRQHVPKELDIIHQA